jgi:hypothetical protein
MSVRLEDNNTNLVRAAWNADLMEESQEMDIITMLTGTYNEKARTIPNGVIMEVDMAGFNTMTLGLLMDLTAAGTQGDGPVITEAQVLKNMQIHAANVRHGVTNDMFGREASLLSFFDVLGRANGQIGKWMKARQGKHIRQSLVENISDNLLLAPHSLALGWNRHILCRNLTDAQQPVYDPTIGTYNTNLYNALGTAGTTSAAVSGPSFFNKISYYATSVWKTKPLDDGTYIALVPSRQKQALMALGVSGSLAELQRTALSDKYASQAFNTILGQIGNLVLAEDPRGAIIVRDAGAVTVTAYFRDVGDTDNRQSYSNGGNISVYDTIPILGKGAVVKGQMMKLRYDDELSDVGKVRQLVASQTYGCQILEYDNATTTATSRVGQNAALALAYSGTITA